MDKIILKYGAHIIMGLAFVLMVSCVKDSDVGSGLLSDDQSLNSSSVDTFTVNAASIEMINFNTTNFSKASLGNLNDADLGSSNAGFACQINLPGNNFSFGDDAVIDSVFLTLKYIDVYGDESYVHRVTVNQLAEELTDTSNYYSDANFLFGEELADSLLFFNMNDSIEGNNGIEENILSIRLNQVLTNQIVSAQGGTELSSDDDFQSFIKGLVVNVTDETPMVNTGSIARFNLHEAQSRLLVFYTSNGSSLSAEFPINASSRTVVLMDNDFEPNSLLSTQLADTITQYDTYGLSGIAGVKLRISFPFLDDLQESSVSVAKARLVIPKGRGSQLFENPSEVWIQNIPTSTYEASSDETNYYIDITSYIQSVLLNNASSQYLDLVISDYFENISRTIVNGPLNQEPLTLSIDFTEF